MKIIKNEIIKKKFNYIWLIFIFIFTIIISCSQKKEIGKYEAVFLDGEPILIEKD